MFRWGKLKFVPMDHHLIFKLIPIGSRQEWVIEEGVLAAGHYHMTHLQRVQNIRLTVN